MTPWSIGWETDVVLDGKNINLTLERLPIVGCAWQLSIINAILLFSLRNFLSNSRTHSSNRALSIQIFRCDRYRHGSDLTFLKHQGFLDFPIANIGSLSQLHLLPRGQWFLSYCAFHLNTCRTLSEMFCSVNTGKICQNRQRCICLLVCTGEGESVRKFRTMRLSFQVELNCIRQQLL